MIQDQTALVDDKSDRTEAEKRIIELLREHGALIDAAQLIEGDEDGTT